MVLAFVVRPTIHSTSHSCFEFTSAEASGNLGFPRGISAGARDWQNIGVEILGGTGRDGIFLGKILGGTGRFFFFSRRDGAVVVFFRGGTGRFFFFRGGTGRLYFFFEAGRDGVVVFFQRRDRAVVFFVRAGTGIFFLAPGRGG